MSSKDQKPAPNQHIKFPCIPVTQGTVTFYVGALPFSLLRPFCTVSPREPRLDDPLYSPDPHPKEQTPQRLTKEERLDDIARFVRERIQAQPTDRKEAIFPGTVILGLLADVEVWQETPDQPSPTAAIIIQPRGAENAQVGLPNMERCLFIIDGQHRLKGLDRLRENLDDEILLLGYDSGTLTAEQSKALKQLQETRQALMSLLIAITLLVDFDLAEQAMVFANVNFKQKTVPRSLYYDIFGAFAEDRVTTIAFTHELVLHLNNSGKSPLQGMIKILGTGPGLVSQAFLGARIEFLIDPAYPRAVFRQFYLRRQQDDKEASRQFASIIRNFFAAVHSQLNYAWPKPEDGKYSPRKYDFILCKSMAMSGLIAALGDIYLLALLDFALGQEEKIATGGVFSEAFFTAFLADFDPAGSKDPQQSAFARGQPWSIGGSAVIEKRIHEEMRNWLSSAYLRQVQDARSGYRQLIGRYRGKARAARIAERTSSRKRGVLVRNGSVVA